MELVKPQPWPTAAIEEYGCWKRHADQLSNIDMVVVGSSEAQVDVRYENQLRILALSGVMELAGVNREKFVLELQSRQRTMEAFTCLH